MKRIATKLSLAITLILMTGTTTSCSLLGIKAAQRLAFPTLDGRPPLVVAHRGASGYRPEHTLAAYQLAIEQGADFIEPDLVATKDGVLIARHENNITDTTNVAQHPEFAARRTRKTIDGVIEQGWFADDFTLAEIKTLRARQRLPFRPAAFDGLYAVPTLQEVIDLARSESRRLNRTIGLYPETKHPSYHQRVGLDLESRLVDALQRNGLNRREAPVFIQSFETANLKRLRLMTPVRLIQLVDAMTVKPDGTIDPGRPYDFVATGDRRTNADLLTPAGLAEIASYADGVAPWKRYLVSVRALDFGRAVLRKHATGDTTVGDADTTVLPASAVIADAHAAGLLVYTWTFRNEARYLASDYQGDPAQEYIQFYCLGVDGVFSDFPDTAVAARTLATELAGACASKH